MNVVIARAFASAGIKEPLGLSFEVNSMADMQSSDMERHGRLPVTSQAYVHTAAQKRRRGS